MGSLFKRWRPHLPTRRGIRRAATVPVVVVALLLLAAAIADVALDRPIQRTMERQINERLVGYTATIAATDFHVIGLSIDVDGLQLSQDANPDPPVLSIRRMTASVAWRALLKRRLVADLILEEPKLHVDLEQLRAENRDDIPVDERGWQDALEAIYPLKIDDLTIRDGELAYRDAQSGYAPLEASAIQARASNIRNISSPERTYPSPIQVQARLFDTGTFHADGHADFLAKPHAGFAADCDLRGVELAYFAPSVKRFGLSFKEGSVVAEGRVEYAPTVRSLDVASVAVAGAKVDYDYGAGADARAKEAARDVGRTARRVMNEAEYLVRIRHLAMTDATVGFVNHAARPDYRVFLDHGSLQLDNLSSRSEDGPATVKLRGSFMGSGKVDGEASFISDGKQPNFHTKLAIDDTQLTKLNDMLRAHGGGIDVVGGIVSVYSDVQVKDGRIEGYVKPLFRDVDVYDPAQDEEKGFFKKLKEKIAGGLSTVLENKPREEVATVATLSGPVEDPDSTTMEVIVNLLRNAFTEAILPGFLDHAKLDDPGKRLDAGEEKERGERGRDGNEKEEPGKEATGKKEGKGEKR